MSTSVSSTAAGIQQQFQSLANPQAPQGQVTIQSTAAKPSQLATDVATLAQHAPVQIAKPMAAFTVAATAVANDPSSVGDATKAMDAALAQSGLSAPELDKALGDIANKDYLDAASVASSFMNGAAGSQAVFNDIKNMGNTTTGTVDQ